MVSTRVDLMFQAFNKLDPKKVEGFRDDLNLIRPKSLKGFKSLTQKNPKFGSIVTKNLNRGLKMATLIPTPRCPMCHPTKLGLDLLSPIKETCLKSRCTASLYLLFCKQHTMLYKIHFDKNFRFLLFLIFKKFFCN